MKKLDELDLPEELKEILRLSSTGFTVRCDDNQEKYIEIADPNLMVLTFDVSKPAFDHLNGDTFELIDRLGECFGYPMIITRYENGDVFSVKVLYQRGVDMVDYFDNRGCIRLQSADHDPIWIRHGTEILTIGEPLQVLHATQWDEFKKCLPNSTFITMAHGMSKAVCSMEEFMEDNDDPADWWKHPDNNEDEEKN